MDQLIRQLEEKVNSLIKELNAAKQETKKLRQQLDTVIHSEHHELTDKSKDFPATDQLQMYIDDSLDLSIASKKAKKTKVKSNHQQGQLSFDLLPEEETTETPIMAKNIDNKTEPTDSTSSPSTPEKKASLTKNQKNNRRLIKLLEERYPKTFNWHNPKPLKIGIDKEMQVDDELTPGKLKRALAAYTRSDRYKKCLLTNNVRIDLEGRKVAQELPSNPNSPSKKTTKRTSDKKPQPKIKQRKNQQAQTVNLDGYSQEERMKIKLEQLITSRQAK